MERFEKETKVHSSEEEIHQAIIATRQGLKGIALVSTATIIAEVGDLTRFDKLQ